MSVLGVILGLVILLFVLLNMPAFQEYAKNRIVDELKEKIGTELGIGQLRFVPFSTLELDSVYLYGQSDEKILLAKKVSAGVDLFALMKGRIVITSAWLSDFEVHLAKKDSVSPLNIQYIIDAFKPQNDKPKGKIEFVVNSLNISDGRFYYDVEDKPVRKNLFDANHIAVSELNGKFALKSLQSDSMNIQVKKFGLKEKSGLQISDLVFRLITQDKKVSVRGFRLDLPSSYLELSRCELDLTQTVNSSNVMDYATIDCVIAHSHFSPKDVAAFTPALQYFKDEVTLEGHIKGSLDDLAVQNLILDYKNHMHLVANGEVKDVRNKDKMYILGSIDQLTLNSTEVESLVNNFSAKKNSLPKEVGRLGQVSFEGDISGYLKQLTAFGTFETDLGVVNADVLFGFNPHRGVQSYVQGKVYTSDFELGKLLANKDLDKIAFNLMVDLEKPAYGKIKGNADGEIHDFGYKGYTYKDIILDIDYDGQTIDGQIDLNDPNGELRLTGMFNLTDKDNPELNFNARARNIQLHNLNLSENMPYSSLSFNLDADFTGKHIDKAEGYIKLDSLDFVRENKVLMMTELQVEVMGTPDDRSLKVTSDIVNAEVTGAYTYSSLVKSVQQTLNEYLPALIRPDEKKRPDDETNIFDFNILINNTENLTEVFKLPVTVLSQAKIIGHYNNIQDKFKLEVFAPSLKAGGTNISSTHILVQNPDDKIDAKVNALILAKNNATNDVSLHTTVKDNLVSANISLINDGKQKAKGEFSISTLFTKNDTDPLLIDINMLPSELLLNNASWKLDKSRIQIQQGLVAVDNFKVYNEDGSQEISINGKYSQKNTNDILKAELKNINLEYIFETLAIDALQFGGAASGNMFISTVENKPYANTRLQVTDFKFNGTELGNLKLFSELDDETNLVKLDGLITSNENKLTKVDGSLDPVEQTLSIFFEADSVDISFLNKYAEEIFQNVQGRGTGNVHLFGNFSDVTVEGTAFIENGGLGINFLNTYYTFTDTVYMKKDLIYFNNITLYDQFKNKALASGKVSHDFFHDFMYHVDLTANNFMLYNATSSLNPFFYGTVYASGNGTISGDESVLDLDIRMRTEQNTLVRLNFMEEVINEYTFITYKLQHAADSLAGDGKAPHVLAPIATNSEMVINMNFYVDATPDATVELLMDPVGGDVLRGSGSGAMKFEWSTKSSPRLTGTYTINRGSYNFTFQRIMERRFIIEDGSTVRFDGDPFQAILDVTALYKVNASLQDLDRRIAELSGQSTIAVNCVLNLTGPLRHPNVGLDIRIPFADAEVERQVKNLLKTEDEINKQVAYLLILSKFRKPEGVGAEVDNPTSDFAAVASASLSSQLTKIVSQIDDRWQLGTNIRYNDKDMTYTEAELLLSSRLLNDRLLINGNFGYRNDLAVDKEAMVTDVDIEYLLNNAGTWRIKAYNHYNEKYYYLGHATQTQGVGIIYKKDFDDLGDLFRTKKIPIRTITDTIVPIVPDSAMKGSSLSDFIKVKK